MAAQAASSPGAIAPWFSGNPALGTPQSSKSLAVIRPISSCCGSSPIPGSPRRVTISKEGMRNGQLSDVSGLIMLPSPEFWHMTTVARPASQAPAAMPTASPSLAAPT